MKRRWLRIVLVILVVLVGLPWLVLESALFSPLRRDLVSRGLSEELAIPVIIEGDVSVILFPELRFSVAGLRIPSTTMPDRDIATLDEARFSVPLAAVASGKFPIADLVVRGLDAESYRDSEGRTSWRKSGALFSAREDNGKPKNNLLRVFYDRRIDIRDIRFEVINEETGFDFLFDLQAFFLDYTGPDRPVALTSHGTLNGQSFVVTGDFPRGEDFAISARFGTQDLTISGAPYRDGKTDGFAARFDMTSPSLGGLLDLLALEGQMDGSGALSFDLNHTPGVIEIDAIDLAAKNRKGMSFSVAGTVQNLLTLDGIRLATDFRLVEDVAAVPHAQGIADFRLLRVTSDIVAQQGRFELTSINAETNAFETGLNRLGPASVGKLFRTEDGRLEMTGITVQSGDPDDPFLLAEGRILDLLNLRQFRFAGTLNGHADMIFPELDPDELAALGRVLATFAVSDDSGTVALETFTAQSTPSDLWSFDGSLTISDLAQFRGVRLDVDMSVAEGAALMEALDLTSVDTGAMGLQLKAEAEGVDITLGMGFDFDGTKVSLDLSHLETPRKNILRGGLFSPEIDLDGVLNLITAGIEFAKAEREGRDEAGGPSLMDDPRKPKPLVVAPDGREIKPMVIVTTAEQNLILHFLKRLDLEFGIKVDRLTGNRSFSGIDSLVVMNRGKLTAGPLAARVAGAHLTLNARSDVILDPGTLHVDGTMGGLSLARLLQMARMNIDAQGALSGSFGFAVDLTRDVPLLRRTTGWARLDMRNGVVASTLIDLAGLGVLPWIFSGRAGQGRSNIVCLVAPLTVHNGTFSSNQVVLETDAVQVVLRGKASVPANSIALRGEPRPAGRPLARSAFPFEVTGKLAKPDVAIVRAGGSSRERPGFRTVVQNHQPCRVYNLD